MAKLEIALLAGEQSKVFLADFTAQVDRLAAAIEQLKTIEVKVGPVMAETSQVNSEPEQLSLPIDEQKEEPPKKKTKKVAEKVAETTEQKAETAPEKTESVDDLFGDEQKAPEITLDDVRKIVKEFAAKHGKDKALKLLEKFKVTSIPDLKKADFPLVVELAKRHL